MDEYQTAEMKATILQALLASPHLKRDGLEAIRHIVSPLLSPWGIKVTAVSSREVEDQTLVLMIDGHRYPIPARIFSKNNIKDIARRVKSAHKIAQK